MNGRPFNALHNFTISFSVYHGVGNNRLKWWNSETSSLGAESACLDNMRKIPKISCIMFILHDALIKFDPINYTKLPRDDLRIQTWFYLHRIPPMAIRNHHLHSSPRPQSSDHHDQWEFGENSDIATTRVCLTKDGFKICQIDIVRTPLWEPDYY